MDSTNSEIVFLGGHLAPSSLCSILFETPLAGKAGWENDQSIAPITTMDSINSKF
jgi:hypothetical protein